MEIRPMRLAPTAAILALGLTLAACGPVNRGLESVNQPVVNRTDFVLDVPAVGLGSPSSPEAKRVADWFDSLELGYGDRVSVDESSAYAGISRDVIAALAAKHGLLLSDTAPVTSGAIEPGAVRIVVSRNAASVSRCPNWDRPAAPEFAGSTMSNFGCATNANLAAMVANPEDLVRGQAGANGDARTTAKAIKSYRDAKPTGEQGLEKTTTKGSN
jgi:pilus assembly protein CpaD